MSNEQGYPDSGILFKNDGKQTDRHPDYKGSGDTTCPHCGSRFQFWLSAWIKQGRKGKFMSLSFKAKEEDSTPRQSAPAANDRGKIEF